MKICNRRPVVSYNDDDDDDDDEADLFFLSLFSLLICFSSGVYLNRYKRKMCKTLVLRVSTLDKSGTSPIKIKIIVFSTKVSIKIIRWFLLEKFKEISLKFRLISFVRNEKRKRDLFYNCKKEKMKPSRGPGVLSQLVFEDWKVF